MQTKPGRCPGSRGRYQNTLRAVTRCPEGRYQPTNAHLGPGHELGTHPEGELPSPPRDPQRDEVVKKTRLVETDDSNSNEGLLGF